MGWQTLTSGIPRSIQHSLIFVDTSAHYAFLDRKDRNHVPASGLWRSLSAKKLRPITSNFVLAESHALILQHIGYTEARDFLKRLRLSIPIERVTEQDEKRALEIIEGYSDKQFTYVDATSFAIMERFRIRNAFAFDKHFTQFGFVALG